ncbi:S-adenosyl-L-methionine-dependent methyltransferase [Pseudomassariella vexata]|uniref:S-adenosyl-L-methionine-dependent methyltransferase n=1 Tax=Pseudomassariella vexata TaxID=1141098 RepID=A0A1Y2E7R6_9PEZI|nr:S-adenosyl-L-methionine-dependent methyltransferase [Pseudomassariella vexata]ORY67601.1 S-adenosyl-L-methionine-dependent methyltransferase [Pseudomassariella vexata]
MKSGDSVVEPDSILAPDGRFYHGYKDGKYFLPNDADEQDRLDFQHAGVMLLLDGRLACAPVRQPRHVMDVATGTGIWALEFARQNPGSHVIGTDLSRIQPDLEATVPNCEFIKEDAEEEWMYEHKFDYVHLRFVGSCFHSHRTVLRHAFDNMNPGGWIEYQDSLPELYRLGGSAEGSAVKKWCDLMVRGAATMGRDLLVPMHYNNWLIETGFVDVHEEMIPAPFNTWPADPKLKEVGKYSSLNWRTGVLASTRRIVMTTGDISPSELDLLAKEVKAEILDEKNQMFAPFFVVYGRKPFDGEIEKSST